MVGNPAPARSTRARGQSEQEIRNGIIQELYLKMGRGITQGIESDLTTALQGSPMFDNPYDRGTVSRA